MVIRYPAVELVAVRCQHASRSVVLICASAQDHQAKEIEDTWEIFPINNCGNLSAGLLPQGECISLKIINFQEANLFVADDLCPYFGKIPRIDYTLSNLICPLLK